MTGKKNRAEEGKGSRPKTVFLPAHYNTPSRTSQKHLKGRKERSDWLGFESVNGVARRLQNCTYASTSHLQQTYLQMLVRCHKPSPGLPYNTPWRQNLGGRLRAPAGVSPSAKNETSLRLWGLLRGEGSTRGRGNPPPRSLRKRNAVQRGCPHKEESNAQILPRLQPSSAPRRLPLLRTLKDNANSSGRESEGIRQQQQSEIAHSGRAVGNSWLLAASLRASGNQTEAKITRLPLPRLSGNLAGEVTSGKGFPLPPAPVPPHCREPYATFQTREARRFPSAPRRKDTKSRGGDLPGSGEVEIFTAVSFPCSLCKLSSD